MKALKHPIWTLAPALALAACGEAAAARRPTPRAPPTPVAGLDVGNETAFQKVLTAQATSPAASTPSG